MIKIENERIKFRNLSYFNNKINSLHVLEAKTQNFILQLTLLIFFY